ncbi:hypothetical protein, partial [Rubrivirga sp.]|uniref:hypothetical protein n=1 Tax=Rubrivirga sp. TaxID=1885344 RepID=UPI003C722CF3
MRALILSMVAAGAVAQPSFVTEVSADQQAYTYGEAITVTYVLRNEGDATATVHADGSCYPGLEVAPSVWLTDLPCTLGQEPVTVEPRGTFTATWVVDPIRVGAPVQDGPQTWTVWLRGPCGLNGEGQEFYTGTQDFQCDVSAQVDLEAPRFEGGGIVVEYAVADADSAAALRREVGASVLDSTASARFVTELWAVEGEPVEDVAAVLEASGVVGARVNRHVSPSREFAVSAARGLER